GRGRNKSGCVHRAVVVNPYTPQLNPVGKDKAMQRAPDLYSVSRASQARSMQRAIAASVIATIRKDHANKILNRVWPRDEGASVGPRFEPCPPKLAVEDLPVERPIFGRFFAIVRAAFCVSAHRSRLLGRFWGACLRRQKSRSRPQHRACS